MLTSCFCIQPAACIRVLFIMLAGSNYISVSHAELVYTWTGQIPINIDPGLYNHPLISKSETWTATLIVDETTPPSEVHSNYALYKGAVKGGSLVFSGGYHAPFSFSGFTVGVANNATVDGVYFSGSVGSREWITISALSYSNPSDSLSLPAPGARIDPSPSVVQNNHTQLRYGDTVGRLTYTTATSNNVSFSATVPEPTSLAMASLLAGSLVLPRLRFR